MKLFVIGNGFDLNHKYRTSYRDYREYLKTYHFMIGVHGLESFFWSYSDKEWSDFENQLEYVEFDDGATISVEDVSNCSTEREEDRAIFHNLGLCEDFKDIVLNFSTVLLESLKSFIQKAVENAIQNGYNKPLSYFKNAFKKDSAFVSFNYTRLLENIYEISDEQICNIHGTVDYVGQRFFQLKEIVFGHGNLNNTKYQKPVFEPDASHPERILNYINQTLKKEYQLGDLVDFLKSKDSIDSVEIIGHSLGAVDSPYFEYINKKIDSNAVIKYWLYDDKDEERINSSLAKYFSGHKIILFPYP